MNSPLTGWRLPLKLAFRDLRRYKGRSALAGLLILLPVMTMAGMLTFLSTVSISDHERIDHDFRGMSASIDFTDTHGSVAFPAAGRVVTAKNPPTSEQVARQAHVPVTKDISDFVIYHPAEADHSFTATDGAFIVTDPTSPVWRDVTHLVSGRMPKAQGEIVVTEYGVHSGLPRSGTIRIAAQDASTGNPAPSARATIVGVVTNPREYVMALGQAPSGYTSTTPASYLAASGRTWSPADVATWRKYGLEVTTPAAALAQAERDNSPTLRAEVQEFAFPIAVGTISFIAVTALLAGPAFAASATRQRRSLGLVAANGGTRAVLRRMVLAHALLLGALTALVGITLGAGIGVVVGQQVMKRYRGMDAPADVNLTWLLGLLAVSTAASLVAAAAPARAASRTNLLQALRGQVSPRKVRRLMPTIGVIGVVIGTLCLYLGSAPGNGEKSRTLLVYLGVPMFFGGAVMAVPYVLMLTGKLARHLPLTPRLAVRDVSRQRTRATASIGAVLATVAVCTAAAIFGASQDAFDRKHYTPSMPTGTGALVATNTGTSQGLAAERDAVRSVQKVVPEATGVWSPVSTNGASTLLPNACPAHADPNGFDPTGINMAALDERTSSTALSGNLHLSPQQTQVLDAGGVLWVDPTSDMYEGINTNGGNLVDYPIHSGKVTLSTVVWGANGANGFPTRKSCTNFSVPATSISAKDAFQLAGTSGGGYIAKRSTLDKHHVATSLSVIALAPKGGIGDQLKHQIEAVAPVGMQLTVEKGYKNQVLILLEIMTGGLAVVVLLTTVVSTLLNDAESQADSATLATVGAPTGMRRRVVGAHAAAIGVIGASAGILIGTTPGLVLARVATRSYEESGSLSGGTYVVPWWSLLTMLVAVPVIAALISMLFARRTPTLTRREA